MPAHLSTLAVAIGLSLILASYLIGSQFHNLAIQILPAVIGTLLIIAAGGNGLSDLVLANPISIILGKISYSLYLYHWPVIVFLLYVFGIGNNVTPIISLAAISLSVLLAYLSYKFVETPYRKAWTKSVKTERIAVPALLISMIAVVMFSAGHIWQHEGLKWRLNAEQRAIVDATLRPRLSCDRREFNGSKDLLCVFGAKKNKIDVAVIGDSHARVLAAGLSKIFEQEGLTGVLINKGGMPPLMNTHTHLTGGVGFEGNSNEYFQTIIDTDPEYILMHARYALYWTTLGTPVEPELKARFLGPIEGDFEYSISKTQEQFQKGLIETIEAIKDAGITPIIVGPVPNPGVNIKQCLSRPYSRNIELILESCGGYSQEDSLKRNAEVTSLINQITKDNGAKFYDPTPIFCKLDEPYCSRLIQDRVLYYDDDHLSLVGSRVLGKRVFSFIDEDKIDD